MQSRKSSFALNTTKSAVLMFVLLAALGRFAGATTYSETTLYTFGTGPSNPDGYAPLENGLVVDTSGHVYGTTTASTGGENSNGTAFELTPNGSGVWTETVIHVFDPLSTVNPNDCKTPTGSLAIDSKGNLYGTCTDGGTNGTGIVWELSPPTTAGEPWTETILYSFGAIGSGDGVMPWGGVTLASAAATTIYGTTSAGGSGPVVTGYGGPGTVYKLTYVKATRTVPAHWKESIIHNFLGPDGTGPEGGLLLSGGNLYGYAGSGGKYGQGVAFELTPTSGAYKLLYSFGATKTDAAVPAFGAPVMDAKKNLYGTTAVGGTYGEGAVWELVYSTATLTYTEQVLYSFNTNTLLAAGANWGVVYYKGNLFGGTGGQNGPDTGNGSVFELTYVKPTKTTPGEWRELDVYTSPAGANVGGPGFNQLIVGKSGNLYGLLPGLAQGQGNNGSVFELSPTP